MGKMVTFLLINKQERSLEERSLLWGPESIQSVQDWVEEEEDREAWIDYGPRIQIFPGVNYCYGA